MRKPVVPRFIGLLLLYIAVFIFLVQLQFAKKNNFTQRTGNLVIQGQYARQPNGENPNTFFLSGGASVFFGGVEFLLREGFLLSGDEGDKAAHPAVMKVADNEVSFLLAEGPDLFFSTQYTGGAIELVIRSDFSIEDDDGDEDSTAAGPWQSMVIPFKPLATSLVQDRNDALLINADGVNYTFSLPAGPDSIVLAADNPVVSYRAVPDRETANPEAFIVSMARNPEEYDAALTLWLDQSYSTWNRAVLRNAGGQENANGELIRAYMSEAIRRGTYKASAVSVSQNLQNASWEASTYVGRLEGALRLLATAERERSTRLARLFNDKSLEILRELHIIEYLAIRGYNNFMDDAAGILRAFDPADMTLEQAAGFLEGFLDWDRYRPGTYNPFDRFVDQALFVITGSLQKDRGTDYALAFTENGSGPSADTELNLRTGSVLLQYDDETKIALGKTLILSVLSLADSSGAVPRKVALSTSFFVGDTELLPSSRIYRICFARGNYARAQPLGAGIWAWTAATSISGAAEEGRFDIAVNFPPGETHYMMIRGVRPFTLLQFNNVTANQDAQFERYDYSGWAYSASEQALLIKLRQRLPTEQISIIY